MSLCTWSTDSEADLGSGDSKAKCEERPTDSEPLPVEVDSKSANWESSVKMIQSSVSKSVMATKWNALLTSVIDRAYGTRTEGASLILYVVYVQRGLTGPELLLLLNTCTHGAISYLIQQTYETACVFVRL